MSPKRAIAWLLTLAVSLPTVALAQSPIIDTQPMRLPPKEKPQVPLHKKELNLEDLFPHTEIPYAYPNPVDLQNMTVGGLSEKNTTTLGANLFIVVDNTKYNTIAELYRANRLKKKSNFVTVDALMHSFLAMRNGMLANMIEEHLLPELRALLAGMLKATSADYKEADDADVRADLEKNLAFLSVGLRLLDPGLPSPTMAGATAMADRELHNILSYQNRKSAIFGVEEDFSAYKPYGWYDSSRRLQNFFRAKQWLSRVGFPLSEGSAADGGGDSFRRSALLFRALDKSMAGEQAGLQVWQRINTMMAQLGAPITTEIKTLTPTDYREVFKSTGGDSRMSLQGLAEPFYRTKLLLSVRRQRPMQISSTSIFDIESSHPERATQAAFRLFPIIEVAELPWLKQRGHNFVQGGEVPAPPLALLVMHAHGITQATNVLGEMIWKLDPTLVNVIPDLMQSVKKQATRDVVWQVLGSYFKMPVEAVQGVLKTNFWMTRKLESGFGAWLDNQIALEPAVPQKNDEDSMGVNAAPEAQSNSAGAGALPGSVPRAGAGPAPHAAAGAALRTGAGAVANAVGTPPLKHYVEPAPEAFRNMRTELQRLNIQMSGLGYSAKKYQQRIQDLTQLLERLETIATREINGLSPSPADATFLGQIDLALEKFSPPTAGSLFLDTGNVNENEPRGSTASGATLALGHPAMLFIIFQSGRSLTVARGAMYSYHELPGGPIKPEHLERKMEFGFLSPPNWAEQFEVIQDQPAIGGN
ncbi:MAG: DUF3160 domain-containing protein [Candidatus Melainabacteria bacterium]|nr:MAG: DUF3160 domain-containing protein [Candidatus Melainabacteria bacterium]